MLRAAVNGLRSLTPFRDVSARLLADLVEAAGTETSIGRPGGFQGTGAVVLTLEGHVELRVLAPPTAEGTATSRLLRRGEAGLLDPSMSADIPFEVAVPRSAGARILVFEPAALRRAVDASCSLAWSLENLPDEWQPRVEAIWLTETSGLGAPLGALAELLAASMAMQSRQHAAVVAVSAGGRVDLRLWEEDRFVPVQYVPQADVSDRLAEIAAAVPSRTRLFFVNDADPALVTAPFDTIRFHRVVYLTHGTPRRVPEHLEARLRDGARGEAGPYFSSFVPAVISPAPRRARPAGTSSPCQPLEDVWRAVRRAFGQTLHGEPCDGDHVGRGREPYAEHRLRRDTVLLRIDLPEVRRRHAAWQRGPGNPSFATSALAGDRQLRDACFGWARAISNRRVGVALSGGGACSFRLVPFLQELENRGVPIDLVSGLSGGALLGAYYCEGGSAGLQRAEDRGPVIALIAFLAIFDSRWITWFLDYDLDGATLDRLAVQFAPLTTALFEARPPEAHYLSRGTLGEAVRASGALPVFVAPVDVSADTRYVDGGTATPLPAGVLHDRGADLVIACNSIPGPESRNPFGRSRFGRLIYHWTLAGRVIDLWVSSAFLLQQISRRAAEDAHVYVEVPPDQLTLLEMFRFDAARELAGRAARDPGLQDDVRRCVELWREFSSR
jgi:predicted acylesterase/phospholipase RssA